MPPVRKFHEDLIRKKFGARAEGILRAPTNEEVKEVTELLTALKLEQDANWEVFNAEKRARMEAAEQNNVNDTNGENSSGASSSTAKTVNAVNVQRGKSMKGMKKLKQSLVDSARRNINNIAESVQCIDDDEPIPCLLYTSPSPRDKRQSRMPSSA